MKKSISIIIIIFACFTALIWSCKKKLDLVAPTSSPNGFAFIKIAQFSPNFKSVLSGRDSFNVYFNGVKTNGAFLTYGSIFPTTSDLYAAVPAGAQSIRITVNGVTTPDSITLATFNKTLTAGSYYSFILTDSLLNSTDSKQIFVQDNFTISDTSHFTVRLVHAVLNDTAGKNIDVYSARLASNLFSNISPGTVTAFVTEPYNILPDTLIVRRQGSLFELARFNTVVFARQRAYTLVYKGNAANTTAPKGRALTIYTNN